MKRTNLLALMAINFGISAYWTVENFWINLYWVRNIDPSAVNVSIMVSISAIAGVFSQIVFGALSDSSKSRFGRRRIYILWGGILGSIFMVLFPIIRLFKSNAVMVLGFAIFLDCTLTLFGDMTTPTRLALLTENTTINERGQVNALISVAGGIGGGIIFGIYFLQLFFDDFYFYLGGALILLGAIGCFALIDDPPQLDNSYTFRQCLSRILQRDSFRENKQFYFLLLLTSIVAFGSNIYTNFVFIYAENALGFSQTEVGLMGIVAMGIVGGFGFTFVLISDKLGRKPMVLIGLTGGAIALIVVGTFQSGSMIQYAIGFGLAQGSAGAAAGVIGVWIQDRCPPKMQSSLLAYLIVANVIPMVPGSLLGGFLADRYASAPGIYSPLFFIVAAVVIMCAIPYTLLMQESVVKK